MGDIFESLLAHLLGSRLLTCHLVQAHQHLHDSYRYMATAQHARIPREGAVGILQLLEFSDSHLQAVVNSILIEEVCQTLFLFALTVSSIHPRSLIQYKVF